MTGTKKKRFGFALGLSIYALVLAGLILIGLICFYFYISAYEYTRPETTLRRYIVAAEEKGFVDEIQPFVDTLDHKLQAEQESIARVQENLTELRYAKKLSACTEDRLVYALKSDNQLVGEVTLSRTDAQRMGFPTWEVTDTTFHLDSLSQVAEVTVPAGYQVRCGSYILDESYLVDDQVHYRLLEEFYDSYPMPAMWRYQSGKYVGDMDVQILDPQGQPVRQEELDEDRLTDNCTAEEKAAIQELTDLYIERYVIYLSGANQAHTPNLFAVVALTVPDSDLYSRLYQALGGQGFASSHGDYLKSITYNHMMRVGEGQYVVDATYLVDTYGQNGAFTTTTNNTKLLLVQTGDGLRAIAQESY